MNKDVKINYSGNDGFSCHCFHDGLDFLIDSCGGYRDSFIWEDMVDRRGGV